MSHRAEVIGRAVKNPATPWVLFESGTVVFMPGFQGGDLGSAATDILKEWGPVQVGGPSGDFRVTSFSEGWFVGCHHNDILTLVTANQIETESPADVEVGLRGRELRDADARKPVVVYVQEASKEVASPEFPLSDNTDLAAAQERLLRSADPSAMTEFLLAGDGGFYLEFEEAGATVYRDTKMPTYLQEPWASLYKTCVSRESEPLTREGPRGFEVRAHGPLYRLSPLRIEESEAQILIAGIDHNGKMKGAAPQALLKKFGFEVEGAAMEQLAKTDRSLGTVVFSRPSRGDTGFLGHVVSTPKHTPESPGWLTKVIPNILDEVASDPRIQSICVVALGTSAGIDSDVAARLMLDSCQQWFRNNRGALEITFSLPTASVRAAFEAEFLRQKVYHA